MVFAAAQCRLHGGSDMTAPTRPVRREARAPAAARGALVEAAAGIAAERGLAGLTVQAVADRAGQTKGCLFHHFATKQALIDEMIAEQFDILDRAIEGLASAGKSKNGRFTRAYIDLVFGMAGPRARAAWDLLTNISGSTRDVRMRWHRWQSRQTLRYGEAEGDPMLAFVRFAADGAGIRFAGEHEQSPSLVRLHARLIDLSDGRAWIIDQAPERPALA